MTELEMKAEQLEIEKKKLELEERKAADYKKLEQDRLEAEKAKSIWTRSSTQLSVVIPILVLIIGSLLNQYGDREKAKQESASQHRRAMRDFIQRQLSKFYYPIQFRLWKDDATWKTAFSEVKPAVPDDDRAAQVREPIVKNVLLPNEDEVLKIFDTHFDLLRNSEETPKLSALLSAVQQYEKHVAFFKALREAGDHRPPATFGKEYRYPDDLENHIAERIRSLEQQTKDLDRSQ